MPRLDQLKELLKGDPNDPFLYFAIAKEYENQENLDNARIFYLDLKLKFPDYVGLYYHLGKLHEELDNANEAVAIYEQGIQVAKKQSDFHALSELNNAKINCELEM